jgi:hypothetical protein
MKTRRIRILDAKDTQRVVTASLDDQHDAEQREHDDFEEPEDGRRLSGRPDSTPYEVTHEECPERRKDPPRTQRKRVDLRVPFTSHGVTQLKHHERHDQYFYCGVAPSDEEPNPRTKANGAVGSNRTRRGNVFCELSDARCGEENAHEGENHRKWQCASRERRPQRNRCGDSCSWRHGTNRLERDFA